MMASSIFWGSMISTPTPRPLVEAPPDPEALIEEARRRSHSRRRRNGLAASVLLGVGVLAFGGHGWQSSSRHVAGSEASHAISVKPRSSLMANGPLTVIRQGNGHGGVYTVGRQGLGRLVTKCSGCAEVEYIAWSPDGSQLALGVTSYGAQSSLDGLHVIDVATGRDRQLTGGPGRLGGWIDPAWSPDGQWIAYESGRGSTIALVKADGSQRATLDTHLMQFLRSPTWSPDGRRIAFVAASGTGGCGDPRPATVKGCSIYVARLDGSHLRLLASHAASPAWSPLGTVIAYESPCGIRLVTPTGADATPDSAGRCADLGIAGQPVFSPDGRKIAINSVGRGARRGVYVMDSDGSDLHRVSPETGRSDWGVARVAWQPVARAR
jgi:dipeptidyl aminopeptidase/acylaminoacyl peptidase